MKITRKMQRHVELKIRHAMATGQMPSIDRNSTTGSHARTEKAEGNEMGHSK